jgi:hypothetical protein
LKLQTFNVPDHLFGTSAGQGRGILEQIGEIGKRIKKLNEEVDTLALSIIEQISRSEDEVSKALAPIFAKAVPHSPDELQRARARRELGNPPGKSNNPIGDQLTWEQILTHFKGKKRLWIISRDGDYGTVYDGKGFLNRFLYDELCKVTTAPEVYLFEDTVEGIKYFVETTGVKAEKQLTPKETEEIEKEEKALPPLNLKNGNSVDLSKAFLIDWLRRNPTGIDSAHFTSNEQAICQSYLEDHAIASVENVAAISEMKVPSGVSPIDPPKAQYRVQPPGGNDRIYE